MSNEAKDFETNADEAAPAEPVVIFRCGWCGHPCNEDGSCIEFKEYEDATQYLEDHKDSTEVLVNGHCCPNGN